MTDDSFSDVSVASRNPLLPERRQGLKQRKRIFCVVVLVTFVFLVLGGLFFIYIDLNAFSGHVSPSDMIPITKDMEPLFCSSEDVEASRPLQVYRFKEDPNLLDNQLVPYVFNGTDRSGEGMYKYFRFYITRGSELSVNWNILRNMNGFVYLFKGFKNWEEYKNDNLCNCWELRFYLTKINPYFSTKVTETNDYLIYADVSDVTVTLKRVEYNLLTGTKECTGSDCHVVFKDFTDRLLVHYPFSEKQNGDISVNVTCYPRLWLFLTIFLIGPVFLMSVCIMLSCLRAACKLKTQRTTSQPPSNQEPERIQNEVGPLYSDPPPQYDSVGFAGLPSYEEATKKDHSFYKETA